MQGLRRIPDLTKGHDLFSDQGRIVANDVPIRDQNQLRIGSVQLYGQAGWGGVQVHEDEGCATLHDTQQGHQQILAARTTNDH
ncbi:hypothetical protein D3C84_542740 [compost metagenome]